jgi:hypothetical protein
MKSFFDAIRPLTGPLKQEQVDGFTSLLKATDGLHISYRAYLLATSWHETAHTMQPITERGGRAYFNKYEPGTRIGKRLGNTAPGDGYLFRGRGYVQITGRNNYALAGRKTKRDLLGSPELALDPALAARILVLGCTEGWFTGKSLGDYLPGDYANARRVVNGTDKAEMIAGYARTFEAGIQTLRAVPTPSPVPAKPTSPSTGRKSGLAAILALIVAAVAGAGKWAGLW